MDIVIVANRKLKLIDTTDQQTYLPVEMQFYISVMFLELPDDIHEEKHFLQYRKNALEINRLTDGPIDGQALL